MSLDSQWRNKIVVGEAIRVVSELPDNSVDLVVTDPPYFLDGLDGSWNEANIQRKRSRARVVGGLPVGMRFHSSQGIRFQQFFRRVAEQLHRVLKPGGFFLSFSQPRLYHRMGLAAEESGFELRDQLAWRYKRKAQMKAFSMDHFVERSSLGSGEKAALKARLMGRKTPQLRPQFESVLLAQKKRQGTFVENWLRWGTGLIDAKETLNGNVPSTVLEVEKPVRESYNHHPSVKPTQLIEHLVRVFSKKGDLVLDCFLGSGTTAIACRRSGRDYLGVELNEGYANIAERRLKALN